MRFLAALLTYDNSGASPCSPADGLVAQGTWPDLATLEIKVPIMDGIKVTGLRQELQARKFIERAKGILMRRLGLGVEEAF